MQIKKHIYFISTLFLYREDSNLVKVFTYLYVQHFIMRLYISVGQSTGEDILCPFSIIWMTSFPFMPYRQYGTKQHKQHCYNKCSLMFLLSNTSSYLMVKYIIMHLEIKTIFIISRYLGDTNYTVQAHLFFYFTYTITNVQ